MQINRINAQSLEISGNKTSFLFTLDNKAKYDDPQMIFGPDADNFISRPGEYEYNDMSVTVLEEREQHIGAGNIFIFLLEELTLCFLAGSISKLDKQAMDTIGGVDLLFVAADVDKQICKTLIADLEPRFVFGIDIMDANAMNDLTGAKANEYPNKLKFKKEDLSNPEYTTVAGIITTK